MHSFTTFSIWNSIHDHDISTRSGVVGIGAQKENFHSASECWSAIIAFIIDFWFLTSFYFAFLPELHAAPVANRRHLEQRLAVCASHTYWWPTAFRFSMHTRKHYLWYFWSISSSLRVYEKIMWIQASLSTAKNSVQLFPLATDDQRQLYAITRSEKRRVS